MVGSQEGCQAGPQDLNPQPGLVHTINLDSPASGFQAGSWGSLTEVQTKGLRSFIPAAPCLCLLCARTAPN